MMPLQTALFPRSAILSALWNFRNILHGVLKTVLGFQQQIVNAVIRSPKYKNTVLMISYDETVR